MCWNLWRKLEKLKAAVRVGVALVGKKEKCCAAGAFVLNPQIAHLIVMISAWQKK
jgi:hypothetical protein